MKIKIKIGQYSKSFEFSRSGTEEKKEAVIVGGGSGTSYRKRKAAEAEEGLIASHGPVKSGKRTKVLMDPRMTQRCSSLLETLMKHKIFIQPLNDANAKHSDYLGTIGSKLANNTYIGIQDFMADVTLALDNALLQVSEEVKAIIQSWKSLEENPDLKVGDGKTLGAARSRQNCSKIQRFLPDKSTKTSESEKHKVVRLKELPLDARAADDQTNLSKLARKKLPKRGMISYARLKGHADGSNINAKPPLRPCDSKSKHVSSRTSSGKDPGERVPSAAAAAPAADALKLDCQPKVSTLTSSQIILPPKSDINPHSDGVATALVHDQISEEILFTASTIDVQMSPRKALRAAELKTRFADTILKAQQILGDVHGHKTDSVKTQQEKKKLEIRLLKEKANVEAYITKEELELKKKQEREREREAARIALEKMENTAAIENNLEIVKELNMLSGWSPSRGNPLHQLGLFLKKEYLEDDDDEAILNEELEEGEILA